MPLYRQLVRGGKRTSARLFVGHGEDAVPAGWGFVEEVILAALPIGARGAVTLIFGEHHFEGFLRVGPLALAVEFAGIAEIVNAGLRLFGRAVARDFAGVAD